MASVERIKTAISLRVDTALHHEERRDGLAQEWNERLTTLGLLPFLVPNGRRSCSDLLDLWGIEAILLTGGNSPLAPGTPLGEDGAPERDRTERELIRYGRAKGLAIVGICRGAQMLNLYFGGSLRRELQASVHVATTHRIRLAEWVGQEHAQVNSFHELCICANRLPSELSAFAWADDGTVEGFHHRHEPILGLMWHPERPGPDEPRLEELLRAALRGETPWVRRAPTVSRSSSSIRSENSYA